MLGSAVVSNIGTLPMSSGLFFIISRAVVSPVFCLAAGLLSAFSDGIKRCDWLLRDQYLRDVNALRAKLEDLLPPAFVTRTLEIAARPPCELRRAAVLQLDVVGFTAMSQILPPMQVFSLPAVPGK